MSSTYHPQTNGSSERTSKTVNQSLCYHIDCLQKGWVHGDEVVYQVGDMVMLSTFNRCWRYCKKGKKRATKFFPHWDSPYKVFLTHPETSSYTIDLPCDRSNFATYYMSKLKLHIPNDAALFPS